MSKQQPMPDLSPQAASRFVSAAGLALDEVGPDRVTGRLELGPEHFTPWGVVTITREEDGKVLAQGRPRLQNIELPR